MDLSPLSDLDLAPHRAEGFLPAAWRIGSACLTGALLEISVHPKPGLVTPRSMGSHDDMDLQTFLLTSGAISPCFNRCAAIGLNHAAEPSAVLPLVRAVGRDYDRLLLAASNGVNTQRGALFALGLVAAGAGVAHDDRRSSSAEAICAAVAAICEGLVERELVSRRHEPRTAGEILHARHGVTGIRGEVEAGFPTVVEHGLPALRLALDEGASLNRALLHALISIIAEAEDTTVLWRGGVDGLAFVRAGASRIRDLGGALGERGIGEIHRFGNACVERRLSPGGAADLLAVTVAVHLVEVGAFPVSATTRFESFASNSFRSGDNP
ncbi:MAG: triphosphoribosyl-dephospho-CoA synthase MdcB [Phyllobacteriaceae bacterium]|nr:triphosphoribosyl-dephospho-CoA synthase MdcB [Phyllobacteriaceae bacterium]